MKNEYQDYSVSALSCASHGIHCILAALFPLSINLSISLKMYFYISLNQFQIVFFIDKKNKCKKHRSLY